MTSIRMIYLRKYPLSVIIIAMIYMFAGTMDFIYHLTESLTWDIRLVLIQFVRILAIIGGIFVLRKANWARWLLIAWITFHLIISFHHAIPEIITHFLFLILTIYCLYNPKAIKFFRK